ncbi:hypothetical protein LTR86_007701 [Recurvomyces mirabilis]|nr:hypothetical protein LTR86_007701 [Recurvomyces mirabilis]
MSSYIWLVTGASSGQGTEIALAALRAGHRVIGTARDVDKARRTCTEMEQLGGKWIKLDVTDNNTESVVAEAVTQYGINVIVNNAGYGLRGVLEDLSMHQVRAQMETNFFGALAVTKGAIPTFRSQRNGVIVMISSASGFSGTPSQSMYSASKFALEGASESLAAELEPFGIRILVVELGAYRTPFQTAVNKPEQVISEAYKGTTADDAAKRITAGHGRQAGDPVKAAQAIVEVVTGTGRGAELKDVFRLPLGKDAVSRASVKMASFSKDVERCKSLAEWACFEEDYEGYPPL